MITLRHLFVASAFSALVAPAWGAPDKDTLQKQWKELLGDNKIESIQAGPIDGLYEVDSGSQLFYTNEKGDKLIFGDILALNAKTGFDNLTEERREQMRVQLLKSLDKNDMITFAAKEPKHSIYVFTDPDCGYCRKFHEQREALLDGGITINYLAMPRTPEGTPSYNKSVAIWCAKDRKEALTLAKEDKFKDTEKTCPEGEKIVATDVALARQFGAQGTPTIVLENGQVIPGYIPAEKLIEYYSEQAKASAG